jgi:hypothetical protein
MQILHNFIILLLLLNIFYHNDEMMDEGIAYLKSIMMWLDLNGNGTSFHKTLMLNWVLPKM